MIRPRFVNELKTIAKTKVIHFRIQNPEGTNKLPSSFVIVEVEKSHDYPEPVKGLFEYAYNALRVVAVSDEGLAQKSGDAIIAFFETPVQEKTNNSNIIVYEAAPLSKPLK